MKKGIDISYWQGDVDFSKVAKNVDFVILREGYRKTVDPKFMEYANGCKRYGIPVKGVYHFCYAVSAAGAREEAAACIENLKKAGLGKEVTVFFDFEYDSVKKAAQQGVALGKAECIRFTKEFCGYVESQGYKAGVYTNLDYYRNMYDPETLKGYTLWLADYTGGPDVICTYQQYTSKGTVPGISGNVDMDYFYDTGEKEDTGMTEMELRQGMANTMNGWIGLKRSDGSHMVIINLYNSCKPLPRGYAVQRNDAYCATTIAAAGIKEGLTDIIPRECGCGQMIEKYQAMGRWVENDAYIPDVGDPVFYDWDDDGKGDCTGWPEHVGLVVKVDRERGKLLITEGNMSGGVVGQRELAINARYIRGYGIPDYASKAGKPGGSSSETKPSGGTSGGINKKPQWVGQVTKTTESAGLPVRSWAGNENPRIKSWPYLGMGNLIDVCDTIKDKNGHPWYYVLIAGKIYGFVDSSYITQAGAAGVEKPSVNAPTYKVGNVYTLQVELKVRTDAGTGCPMKSYSQLTADGKRHDKDRDGCLDAGTQVTCQAVKKVGKDIWIKAPSGWMAAYYQEEIYIK